MNDTFEIRRKLKHLHDELRNRGMNPLEALAELRRRLPDLAKPIIDGPVPFDGDTADLVAIVYQEVLAAEARNGLGQYLTPLPVAELLATVLAELAKPSRVLDPFCGVGLLLDRAGSAIPEAELQGIEINSSVAEMAVALAQVSGRPIQVAQRTDTFSLFVDGTLPDADVVVSNPPFGALVAGIDCQSPRIPNSLRGMSQIPAELLGLEACLDALREDGLLGIVLPQSVMTNRSWRDYRKELFSKLIPIAVVSLPEETFAPFKGVAKACVLFGRKRATEGTQTVPYFVCKSVGYSATGRSRGTNDLPDIAKRIILADSPDRLGEISEDGVFTLSAIRSFGDREVRLGDVAEVFVGKNPPLGSYADEGPWLVKVGDLSGSMLAWRTRSKNRVNREWFARQKRIHLQSGDVCMTAAGHRPKYIGLKVDLVDELPPDGAAPSGEVLVIRVKATSRVAPEHLLFFFRSSWGYGLIQDLVRGSTGHLYPGDVVDMKLPPIEEFVSEEAVDLYRRSVRAFREYRHLEKEALSAVRLDDLDN